MQKQQVKPAYFFKKCLSRHCISFFAPAKIIFYGIQIKFSLIHAIHTADKCKNKMVRDSLKSFKKC